VLARAGDVEGGGKAHVAQSYDGGPQDLGGGPPRLGDCVLRWVALADVLEFVGGEAAVGNGLHHGPPSPPNMRYIRWDKRI
jgi:hypothetical protein